MARERVPVAA